MPDKETRKPDPEVHPIIKRLNAKFAQALSEARRSSAMTDTEKWRNLYAAHKAECKARWEALGDRLELLAKAAKNQKFSEDEMKELSAIKKDADEQLAMEQHFESNTVMPVRQPVDDCRKIIADAMDEANAANRGSPMYESNVVNQVENAIDALPKPMWRVDIGTVEVSEP